MPDAVGAGDTTAQGQLIRTQWYSHTENIYRRVDIYLPAAYQQSPVPVLYLMHGINGYEGSWIEKGRAAEILDSLIVAGLCPPLILVMPDCNKWPYKERPTHGNLWRCLMRYPRLSREHEIEHSISDLMDMVDTTFRVLPANAIAGLSDGARIAANVANIRPDHIRAVGIFSPVLHKEQLPKDTTQAYSVYVGKADIFYANGKRFHKRMQKNGYPHEWIELRGNHNWRMWQACLIHFLEQLPNQ